MRPILASLGGALLGIGIPVLAAHAEDTGEFYRDKRINLVLSAGEGGGYASYAQAFAPYFTAHIPGNPRIVIQSMPGAGGIRAMFHLYAVAPKDGTTLGLVHSSVPFAPLYGIKGASFDPRQMNWIGSLATAGAICVAWHQSGITSWQDLLEREYIVGGSGAGSQMETLPAMLNKLFKTRIKIVSGYKGGNEVYIAMERGEVHGRCGGLYSSISSTRPDWFPQRKVAVPIQVTLERSPQFPDVPAIVEFAKDERTKQILELILAPQAMDRPFLAPPGVPAERIAALRAAFHAAMRDPGFIAEARRHRLEVDEVPGEKIAQILERAYSMPAEVVKAANDAMNLAGTAAE